MTAQQLLDGSNQGVGQTRLNNHLVEACAQGPLAFLVKRVGGQGNDQGLGTPLIGAKHAHGLSPRYARHADVEEDDVRPMRPRLSDGLFTVSGDDDVEATIFEILLVHLEAIFEIVDEKYRARFHSAVALRAEWAVNVGPLAASHQSISHFVCAQRRFTRQHGSLMEKDLNRRWTIGVFESAQCWHW
jgi:hypothetical protein